ncbi:hypothetical protein BROUX41_001917 [Berkeleyomyces rouxiae]|uniref:uncharacterized protein n=1 Tax=Berkeleyomyces rouxiae TaxID=2035830 RepID=UPI003B7BE8C4
MTLHTFAPRALRLSRFYSLLLSVPPLLHTRRLFSSNHHPPMAQTHYDVLAVPTTASPVAIKKAFYALSKTYHPDLNPDNPSAKAHFQRISEAYAVLSVPAKRSAYDRSTPAVHQRRHASPSHTAPRRSGSYASSSPAGGRPASGLSSRRTPFFHAGAQYAKRQAAHGGPGASHAYSQTDTREHAQSAAGHADSPSAHYRWPGTGPGPDPLHSVGRMAHFDAVAHFQTHMRQEVLRNHRRAVNEARQKDVDQASSGSRFFLILAMVVGGVAVVPVLIPSTGK